jgi:DNA polymerase-3 subunit epsilon
MNPIIFIDTETGGIEPEKHSLLSIGLVAWSMQDGIIGCLEVFIKSKEYIFTKEAQRLNKFDKEEHEKKAVDTKDALKLIEAFISKYCSECKNVQIAGHNTQFDVAFLKVFFKQNGRSFNQIFSHRIIDTYSILKFLVDAGVIEDSVAGSGKAFMYFNIKVQQRHSALSDAVATSKLYEELLLLVKKMLG